ncbi:MAG: hypothetical protein IMZ71_04810 [Chloroflexi bacterium]|nr:hypothetical protein [Chloroflexota bacterium]
MQYRIKTGFGYWDTTNFPIGGSFARAGNGGLTVEVQRTFPRCQSSHGTNAEGKTADGRKVAFDTADAEPVETVVVKA